jgi:hypothetical protein
MAVMGIVAQWVRTEWTKKSRGGAEAAQRNAAPAGFPLPVTRPPLVHTVVMTEENGFQPQETLEHRIPRREYVHLIEADGRLLARPIARHLGAPERRYRPQAVWIPRGEWVRWQINYRFGGESEWRYSLDTLNIAYGDVSSDIFLGTPHRLIDEREHLR